MRLRRRRLLSCLQPDEIAPTVTSFIRMGVKDFYYPPVEFSAPSSASIFVPDSVINPHPRFGALTRNIRARRGRKVDIRVPLFKDTHTPEFLRSPVSPSSSSSNGSSDDGASVLHSSTNIDGVTLEVDTDIHMDCMAFGMGMVRISSSFKILY